MHAPIRLLLLPLLTLCCIASAVSAAPPPPDQEVRETIDQVKKIVQSQPDKSSPTIDKKLREVLFPLFDFKQMSKSSLGPNWRTATPEEQEEFERLFSDLLARTYLKRIKSGVTDSKIEVKDSSIDGDKALVKTTVTADAEPIAIDYRLQSEGDAWKVYDVSVENVGLITNYREEFAEIVREQGMKGLIERLKDKQAKAEG